MRTFSQYFLAATSILVLSCTYADQHEADGTGDEIIVKFAAGQAINETIVQAFDNEDAEASLEKTVQELSTELGVPLVYSRLTSGREIVVEIPVRRVYELIDERIRDSEGVENTAIEKREVGSASDGPNEILVTVDSSKINLDTAVDVDAVAARLVNDARLPVICDVRDDGRLAVTPDFEHLVGTLVKGLSDRRDIDYAQPNYKVRHYNNTQ